MTNAVAPAIARPHCRAPDACQAKGRGRHCIPCAANAPDCVAKKSASLRAAFAEGTQGLANLRAGAKRCATDPEIKARRIANLATLRVDPAMQARHRDGCRRGAAKRLADPVKAVALREIASALGRANLGGMKTAKARAKVSASMRERWIRGCPPSHRARNDELRRKRVPLAERKSIIAREVELQRLSRLDHEVAAAHLRRLAPTVRCDERGRLDPVGSHWRYGTAVKTRLELIQLALAKGWKPEGSGA